MKAGARIATIALITLTAISTKASDNCFQQLSKPHQKQKWSNASFADPVNIRYFCEMGQYRSYCAAMNLTRAFHDLGVHAGIKVTYKSIKRDNLVESLQGQHYVISALKGAANEPLEEAYSNIPNKNQAPIFLFSEFEIPKELEFDLSSKFYEGLALSIIRDQIKRGNKIQEINSPQSKAY